MRVPGCFALLLIATACAASDRDDGELVTMLNYVQTGRAQVALYLEHPAAASLRQAITTARHACVRLRSELDAGAQTSHLVGSGVLLADGRVLTAGHVVPAGTAPTTVTLADGSPLPARLLARERDNGDDVRDWALLEIEAPPHTQPVTTVAPPRRGQLVAILGYPQGLGVDGADHVARDWAGQSLALAPVATLARVISREPLLLAPVAGSLPIDGGSGSAVLDARGRLLGVVVAAQPISRTWLAQRADRVPLLAPPARRR